MTPQHARSPSAADLSPIKREKAPVARLLVVDDEALIRWWLSERLSQAGYEVAEAPDGRSALTTLSSQGPFDLVVLDLKLPDTSGLSLLERIRQIAPDCRVVMMSAFATSDDLTAAGRIGVDEIIAKPFDVQYLLSAVDRELHRAA